MRRWLLAIALLPACIQSQDLLIGAKKLRESCKTTAECVPGLICDHETCVPILSARRGWGEKCGPQLPCIEGFCCGADDYCKAVHEDFEPDTCGFGVDHSCFFDTDCQVGLDCRIDGICVDEELAGPGEPCADALDCRAPLVCGPTGFCDRIPLSFGTSCALPEEELGNFRPYFDVSEEHDFYRLPFPNELHRKNGTIELSKHPSPGKLFGYDASELFFDPIERDSDGFSLISPIFIRFSDTASVGTLWQDDGTPAVQLVDIDPDSPFRGERVPVDLAFSPGRGRFICENALIVAPVIGRTLEPNTTYAVLLTTSITSSRTLSSASLDRDLETLLDADQTDAYTPLRDYLEQQQVKNLSGATVFTTGDPGAIVPRIRAAIRAANAPEYRVEELVDCELAEPAAPCACPEENGAHRFAGRLTLPVLQTGTRPYLDLSEGGTIPRGDGALTVAAVESVCFGLMVPTSTITPAQGWPIVIHSHGTGGSYISTTTTIVPALTALPTPMAVLTYEAVMHGSRRGASTQSPELLFFNLLNPPASRDNVLQAAGDLFALVKMIERDAAIGSTPIDPQKIMFYGHSQGSLAGVPFLRHEDGVHAAVLSGAGGDIGLSLVSKRSPVDIAAAVYALTGARDRFDPTVGLIDLLFGPADSITYASGVVRGRSEPLHLLMVSGTNDSYVPEESQLALLIAMKIPFVGEMPKQIFGVEWISSPASGNINGATAGVVQYAAGPDYDGHFVATRDLNARRTVARFLQSAAEGVPVIER